MMESSLLLLYASKRADIQKRLGELEKVKYEPNEKIFAELAFCLCTPQSKAINCWNAITSLRKNNLLFAGKEEEIKPFLNAVRFSENKSKYIVGARNFFTENEKLEIKNKLEQFKNSAEAREWLVENIKGFGMKEASHFLRNIGRGNNLAILDVHILKNLREFEVIKEIPKSLTPKKYIEIEEQMKRFSESVGIPFDELDLLLWSKETGMVFK
jgi:N-glycosylase/DNA lyase